MNGDALTLLLHLVPEDPEPLREQIARQLRHRIVRGELAVGTLLPGHRQLARQHRVAPSTVEAAYELLVSEGMLSGSPAGEVSVAALDAEHRHDLVERLQLEELVAQELGRRELEMARDVQRRLLPPSELSGPGWEVAARCLPARVVAGDFYDVLRHGDGSVDLVVADVAGKGFAASLIMASVKAMLPFVTSEGGVAESLTHLNSRLASELGRGEFVALTLARYQPSTRQLELANAGAPDPYLVRPGQPPQPLSVPGPRLPLGVRLRVAYASRTVKVDDGASLLMLTDGLPEARDADGEPLGYQALESMLAEEPGDPAGNPLRREAREIVPDVRDSGRIRKRIRWIDTKPQVAGVARVTSRLAASGSRADGAISRAAAELGVSGRASRGGSPSEWLTGLFDRVQQRTGRLPEDDWTAVMLVLREREGEP